MGPQALLSPSHLLPRAAGTVVPAWGTHHPSSNRGRWRRVTRPADACPGGSQGRCRCRTQGGRSRPQLVGTVCQPVLAERGPGIQREATGWVGGSTRRAGPVPRGSRESPSPTTRTLAPKGPLCSHQAPGAAVPARALSPNTSGAVVGKTARVRTLLGARRTPRKQVRGRGRDARWSWAAPHCPIATLP